MNKLVERHPADIAEQLAQTDTKERNLSFLMLPDDLKASVFSHFDRNLQKQTMESIGMDHTKTLINNLAPDDRTKFFTHFSDDVIKTIIHLLNDDEKAQALSLLGYEQDSIARLMTPHYIAAKADWTVEKTLKIIKKKGQKAETLNFVYVVDEKNRLIDDLRIGQLLMASKDTKLSDLMDYNYVSLLTKEKIEDSFKVYEKYGREALPIVTQNNILVGIVTWDDVFTKVHERDTEDIQKFGGLEGLDLSYTKINLFSLVQKRAGWLIVLFLGEMFTASAMGYYDEEIAKAVVLALFVPLIISSGGNSGSQAASLIIRAMALGELRLKDWWYVMRKEIFSGLLLGAILGIIGFVRIFVWQKLDIYDYGVYWFWVALSVACSLVIIVLWGTLSGSLIPFILKRIGLDPATASAPFVATMVDVTGLIIYFSISAVFLSGKLL